MDVGVREQRLQAFRALIKRDGSDPEDYAYGEEEDPRPYLAGEEPCGRYVCVTCNWSSSDGKLFYLPIFEDISLAIARAEEYDRDDVFEEVPIKVVDLDTGNEYYAEPIYTWKIKAPQSTIVD